MLILYALHKIIQFFCKQNETTPVVNFGIILLLQGMFCLISWKAHEEEHMWCNNTDRGWSACTKKDCNKEEDTANPNWCEKVTKTQEREERQVK